MPAWPEVLDDPGVFRRLIERHSPYYPVQRYFAGNAEYRSSSGQGDAMIIAPNFRGDWAYDEPIIDGVETLFHHPGFICNAEQLFDTDRIRPLCLFANITWQLPFNQGEGHIDVPEFRGIDRTQYPTWLLSMMSHSPASARKLTWPGSSRSLPSRRRRLLRPGWPGPPGRPRPRARG